MSPKAQLSLLWTGIILALIYFIPMVFLLDFIPPPRPNLDASTVAALYTQNNLQFRFGIVVMLAASGFWFPISMAISSQMSRHETGFPMWTFMQGVASAIGALLFILPPLMWGVAAFTAERNPEITLMMHEFGWLTFFVPIGMFAFQLIPVIVIAFTSKFDGEYTAFPRWIGYLTILEIMSGEIPVFCTVFKTGPFAWNGVLAFWQGMFFYSVWIMALAYTLSRAIRHQAAGQFGR